MFSPFSARTHRDSVVRFFKDTIVTLKVILLCRKTCPMFKEIFSILELWPVICPCWALWFSFSLCSINVPKFDALSLDLVPFFPVQCGHEPGQLCLVAGPVHCVQCPLATWSSRRIFKDCVWWLLAESSDALWSPVRYHPIVFVDDDSTLPPRSGLVQVNWSNPHTWGLGCVKL